jgi:hypothetical protein
MIFADAALDIPVFKIALEGGYQFGKKQSLVTTFADNDPNARRLFAGAGLRFSF